MHELRAHLTDTYARMRRDKRRCSRYDALHRQIITLPRRQWSVKEFLLEQHLQGMLSCLFELAQYKSPLNCLPYSAAGLLTPESDRFEAQSVKTSIMNDIRHEWEMTVSMEAEAEASTIIHRQCPQTLWQSYREIGATAEQEGFVCSQRLCALVNAWLPNINSSANVEDSFAAMADAVARSGKADLGSLCNLQAVHIRSTNQKMTDGDGEGCGIHLASHDFEGNEIRGLRPRLFLPASFNGSAWTCCLYIDSCVSKIQ